MQENSVYNEEKKENYDIFDLVKYILSFFIVAIYTGLYPSILYPWLRIAVPLFFIISSYLLFSKINRGVENEFLVIKKYISRQIKMYIFWFIVLLPFTIIVRKEWFSNGIVLGLFNCLKNTLFSSTFIASWYITSSIWGVIILYKASKKMNPKILTILASIIYFICCLRSSYYLRIIQFESIEKIINTFEILFVNPVFSFPVAIFWMNIGKLFADKKIKIKNNNYYFGIIISALLLYFEWIITIKNENNNDFDLYFMLAPFVIFCFIFILKHNVNIKKAYTLRKISVITYPMHASIAKALLLLFEKLNVCGNLASIISFVSTIIICHLTYFIFLKLSKYEKLKILKNAY